jgi:hypothetical protein
LPGPWGEVVGTPRALTRLIAFDISVAQHEVLPHSLSGPHDAWLHDRDNRVYEFLQPGLEPRLRGEQGLQPGETVRGWITFAVPERASLDAFVFDGGKRLRQTSSPQRVVFRLE